MIIMMTCNNNDMTDYIEKFSTDLVGKIIMGADNVRQCKEFVSMMSMNRDKKLTQDEKRTLIECIKRCWLEFIEKEIIYDEDSFNFCKERFIVQIVSELRESWRNGEVVYYFTTNNKFITY